MTGRERGTCTYWFKTTGCIRPLRHWRARDSRYRPRYSSRSSSGIFAWISGGRDAKSVAQVWRQLAHFSVTTVMLLMRSLLPTC